MSIQHFLWNEPKAVPDFAAENLEDFSEPFQSILFHRGITTSDEAITFLLPKEHDWHRSIKLRQIDTACQIISSVVEDNDLICVYGDYDADGITSTALLTLALRKIGGNVLPFLPNRFTTGYGLNNNILTDLAKQGVKLLITVDNGIRSVEEISYAKSLGLTVIVTDHHEPGTVLPEADALINPKLPDDIYPNKQLAGVGVIYKLVCALGDLYPILSPQDYLDLVAIGTVADVVPLTGENRYLVKQGLSNINRLKRQGIVSLIGAANLNNKKITSADISFQIAPRINSSGRLETQQTDTPLKLLLSTNTSECGNLAQELENHNTRRRALSFDLQSSVESEYLKIKPHPQIIMSFNKSHHLGVAGIAAGHLARKYNSPVIVGQIGSEFTVSSCRSIPDFNMIGALDQFKEMFIRYGGHKMAAGFTIKNNMLSELENNLNSYVNRNLTGLDLSPRISIDSDISLGQINNNLFNELDKLEPTGSQNREALFLSRNLSAKDIHAVGKNSDHLKMVVSDGEFYIEAIGFGMGDLIDKIPAKFDVLFALSINKYRGKESFQLKLQDLRSA